MKRAAFWVAWGWPYVDEARTSAESVRRHMPDLDLVLYVRRKDVNLAKKRTGPAFNKVIGSTFGKRLKHAHLMLHGLRYRVDAIHQLTEYDQLLFLDTDIHMCAPIYDVFEALDKFDIMFTLSTGLRSRQGGPVIPDIFPEYNSGVVPFRNNDKVRAFHDRWLALYMEHKYAFQNSNQRSLREAVWTDKTGLRVYVMPPEYNCRFQIGTWVKDRVKILHGRSENIGRVEVMVNRDAGRMRAWKPWALK